MAFGQIAGAVIGGIMGNQAAARQSRAMERAAEMAAMGYMDARPYVLDMYKGGTDAMQNRLNTGFYEGPTYAGLNDMQTRGLDNLYDFNTRGFGFANNMLGTGANYASNFADLYNRASEDQIGNAINFANANSAPLVDAALRDSTRNLQENTLQRIGQSASATNNLNASKRTLADVVAGRDYLDRAADTSAGIKDRLMKDYLTQSQNQFSNQMAANRGLGDVFNTGFGMGGDAANRMTAAGAAYQKDLQNQYDDARRRFEGRRDFASDVYGDYNQQIIQGAPRTPPSPQPNLIDPTMATLSGAMAGFGFGQKYFPSQPQVQPNVGYQSPNPTPTVPYTSYY